MPETLPADFITAPKELPYAQHVLGTKDHAYHSMDETIRNLTERLGPIAHMHQVHGKRIVYAHTNGISEECDAIYTDKPDLWLAVKTADCVPILISSPVAVAAIHAGWRGLENEIIDATINTLMTEFGLEAHEMHAIIGPCISQENYEVDATFERAFIGYERHISESESPNKVHLNLRGIAEQQLIEAGMLDINITTTANCTFEDTFFSYRKGTGKEAHQRQLSLIKRI